MKKLVLIFLVGFLVLPVLFSVTRAETGCFSDTTGHKYEDAVCYVKDGLSLIKGYADGTFKPDQAINRAEFTKMYIGHRYGHEMPHKNCFSDVKEEWFAPYICAAKEFGVIGGYPDGSFGPAKNINLAETVKIILEDSDEIELVVMPAADWWERYLSTAEDQGWLVNLGYNPGKTMTRAEIAEIFFQMQGSGDEDYFYPCDAFGPCSYEENGEVVDVNGDLWYLDESINGWVKDEGFKHQGDEEVFHPCKDFGPCQLEEEGHVIDNEGRHYYWNDKTFEWDIDPASAAG